MHRVPQAVARRRRLAIFAWAAMSLLVAVGSQDATAVAAGSPSIASAPTLVPDVLTSANLAADPTEHQGDYSQCEWWLVNLDAHDDVEITGSASFGTTLYSPGTNDSNYTAVQYDANGFLSAGLSWSATSTGSYPLSICGNAPGGGAVIGQETAGPFTFQVNIQHSSILYVAAKVSTKLTGSLLVYVRDVTGNPITSNALAVKLYGLWKDAGPVPATKHLLTVAHPVNGIAHLRFKLPHGLANRPVTLIVEGSGSTYQRMTPRTCIDKVV
jgi:hypothetical protein